MRHSNLWNELDLEQPRDNSNLYIGIAMGVMIVLCGVIYVVVSVLEQMMVDKILA
jgi:hypothetical protein